MSKKKTIARLEYLATAREEYLTDELRALVRANKSFSFWTQTENDKAIYAEVSGMRAAIRALKGDVMQGWLPSWRWDEYAQFPK